MCGEARRHLVQVYLNMAQFDEMFKIGDAFMNKICVEKGQIFGYLTVIKELASTTCPSGQKVRWVQCKCSCGKIVTVSLYELTRKTNNQKSCGCYGKTLGSLSITKYNQSELAKLHRQSRAQETDVRRAAKMQDANYIARRRLHNIHHSMLERCYNKKADSYKYYGGKGINVCDEWKNSFDTFVKWALTHGYNASLSLDRIDSNQSYCPENCRWVTKTIQANNTSRNVYIASANGELKTIAEWGRVFNLPADIIRMRYIRRQNCVIEDINFPIRPKNIN